VVAPREILEFLSWLSVERGRAPNTVAAYRRDLRAYSAHLTEIGSTIADATPTMVEHHLARLVEAGRAPVSVARALVAVRGLHAFLADEDEAPTNPAAAIDKPRVPMGLPKALTEAQISSLLKAVTGDDALARRDRAALEILYGCGLRVSELVGLSLGDIDLDSGLLRAFGKGSKERMVPVGRLAAQAVQAWLAPAGREMLVPARWARRRDADAVFLNRRGGRLSRQGAWAVVRRHAEAVGLADCLTPHVLRHSCATHMLDHGADIRAVQELLGHASISTTRVYTKVSTDLLQAAYDQAHPRSGRYQGPSGP